MPAAWDADTTPPIHGGDPSVIVAISDAGAAFSARSPGPQASVRPAG